MINLVNWKRRNTEIQHSTSSYYLTTPTKLRQPLERPSTHYKNIHTASLFFFAHYTYKCEYVSMSRICDVTQGTDHVVRFTRPSGSVFAYCKQSKTGAGEGLGTPRNEPRSNTHCKNIHTASFFCTLLEVKWGGTICLVPTPPRFLTMLHSMSIMTAVTFWKNCQQLC